MGNERSILSGAWSWRRIYGVVGALVGLLVGAFSAHWLGATNTQLLLTALVVGVGGLVARRNLVTIHRFPLMTRINLALTAVWEACSLLLIWTSLRAELLLWRTSWTALIALLGSTHLLALLAVASGWARPVSRVVLGATGALTLLLVYPATTPAFPALPGTGYLWTMALLAAVTVLGSVAFWPTQMKGQRQTTGVRTLVGMRWVSLSQVALVLIGLCIGRATSPQRQIPEVRPSSLADLTREELTTQLDADLNRLKALDTAVTGLLHQMEELQREFGARFSAEQRDYYLPYEGAQMRSHFRSFLAYRASLLRLVADYAGLDELPDPRMRARCFTLGLAAAMRTYESSMRIVLMYRDHVLARRTLNESQQQFGVDGGMFDWVYESVTSRHNVLLASRMMDRFTRHRMEWRDAEVWPSPVWNWLDTRITAAMAYVRAHPIDQRSASVDLFLRRLGDQAYGPVYELQAKVAEWMGDTRIVDQPPAIQSHQMRAIESELRPGDIMLQRREWYVGNAFLPGFWSHAALYVGRIEDLRRLGIADHPTVQAHLQAYLAPTSDGGDRTVIEALSEGVVFNSLVESLHADHVAVLRPNLSERARAQAIINAFEHHGRPYDFDFDFATADKLVCTEVVYRAYQGMLDFDLVRIMGRNTLPAAEIGRKFARERHNLRRELNLVLYYETPPAASFAQRSTEQAFEATVVPSSLARAGDPTGSP
jgi:hypothetical protein